MHRLTRSSADKTRAAILKTATALFAEHGYFGVSTNDIARASKIGQSLLYHHFKNKEGLWEAVRQNISAKFYKQHTIKYDPQLDLKTFITNTVITRFNFLKNNPNIFKIIYWQRFITKTKKLQITQNEYTNKWYDLLKNMQQLGKIRKDYSVEMIALLIRNTIHGAFDVALFTKQQSNICDKQKEYLKLVIDCLYNGLKTH
ncbi:MAG: TetR/AcrR family transcriptional regulator [Gammaproteobacteria bacterium]|nr:TetR/AcrR family transcriptional regulator [Gammaproteobacteria bacterium]